MFIRILLLIIPCYCYGQTTLRGTVLDQAGNPIPFANVLAFEQHSQALIKGDLSDSQGKFTLTVNSSDTLYVQIRFLGYQSYTSDPFYAQTEINLGNIILRESSEMLDEVSITAQKPLYEQRIDRTIVNVEGSIMSKGNSVLSILSKSPSVRVNMSSGDVSLLGKSGVLIMIDDKPLRLERQDLINFLSGLSADNIATLELITAPPANYDAQGVAGIINITTIQKRDGLQGQFTPNFGIGKRPKYGQAFTINYQKNKLSTYALVNTTLNYDLEKVTVDITSETLAKSSNLAIVRKPKTGLYTGEFGIAYDVSAKTTLGVMLSVLQSDWYMHADANSNIISDSGPSALNTHSYEENRLSRLLYNFNGRHHFSKKLTMTIDLDHIDFTRKNPTIYTVTDNTSQDKSRFLSTATTPVHVSTLKADWNLTLSGKLKADLGVKVALSEFTNDVNVAREENDEWVDDSDFKNQFSLSEDIYATYASVNFSPNPKFNAKAGLRYEYYDLNLGSSNEGTLVNRRIGNFFPSVFLSYAFEKERSISFSLVNRIQRPGFLILAPYFYFFDQNTLTTGNPTILPSRVNQFQVGYSFPNVSVSLQHNIEHTPILDFQPVINASAGLFEIRPFQGLLNTNTNITLNYVIEPVAWWNGRLNFLGYYNKQKFNVESQAYDRDIAGFDVSTVQTISIKNVADLEITAGYYSRNVYGTLDVLPRKQVDLGVRKKLKSDIVFSFSINDIFNTGSQWPNASDLSASDLDYYFNFDAEGPVYRWAITIPFGKRKEQQARRESGSTDELNRIR